MHAEDETGAERPIDPLDRLRHDLRSPLTTIGGRAYLLARAVRRAPSLSEDERTRLLASVATIEAAVAEMVVVIDGIGGSPPPEAHQRHSRGVILNQSRLPPGAGSLLNHEEAPGAVTHRANEFLPVAIHRVAGSIAMGTIHPSQARLLR